MADWKSRATHSGSIGSLRRREKAPLPRCRPAPLLFGESRNKGVRESLPPFQILGHPSISLCKSSLHEAGDIALAGTGQLGVFLCFSSIALCSFRFAFHFNIPPFTPADVNSEIGRPDEGDGAKARTNWARRAATDNLRDSVSYCLYRSAPSSIPGHPQHDTGKPAESLSCSLPDRW